MMDLRPCGDVDYELIAAASSLLSSRGREGHNRVGAAVRTRGGEIFLGLDLVSRKSDICAEPVALGAAAVAGKPEIALVVAVVVSEKDGKPKVISPCGSCRELLYWQARQADVLVNADSCCAKVAVAELFRFAEIERT